MAIPATRIPATLPLRYVVSILAVLWLTACGGDSSSAARPAESAPDLLSRANAAFAGVKTVHFKLVLQNGTLPLPLGLDLSSAEGDIALPATMSADVNARAAGVNLSLKVISVGDSTWITNPFTRQFQKQPGVTLSSIVDPIALVSTLASTMQGAKVSAGPQIDGAATLQVTGTLQSSDLEEALPSVEPGFQPTVDIWIGANDGLPRRARINGPLTRDQGKDTVWLMDFSRYNAAVVIRPPG